MKRETKVTKLIHWLDTGIFPATIMFSVGFTHDEIIKYLIKVKANEWKDGIADENDLFSKGNWCALRRDLEHTVTNEKKTLFYINIPRAFDFSDGDYCKLAHEVLHITQFMMKDFLDPEREYEAVAYTHTHIMEQCLKSLRGENKK